MLILLLQLCMEGRFDAHIPLASLIRAFMSVRNINIVMQGAVTVILVWGRNVKYHIMLSLTQLYLYERISMHQGSHVVDGLIARL